MTRSATIPAGQFKAQCLALLDRVSETGETLVVTKHGRPVARVVPVEEAPERSLLGSVKVIGNIVDSTGERWDADK